MTTDAGSSSTVGRPGSGGWRWERHDGSAADLHQRPWPEPLVRTVWDLRVRRPALVLGSTQDDVVIDRVAVDAADVEVARRRSGGGLVRLDPTASVWLDVFIPRGDARWDDDVSRSPRWLGAVWRDALAELGIAGSVHEGPMVDGPYGRLICFAGVGPGEVVVSQAAGIDAKVVGISQRRTRAGARFQCQAYVGDDPVLDVADLVAAEAVPGGRDSLRTGLRQVMAAVPVPADALRRALAAALATA